MGSQETYNAVSDSDRGVLKINSSIGDYLQIQGIFDLGNSQNVNQLMLPQDTGMLRDQKPDPEVNLSVSTNQIDNFNCHVLFLSP